MGTRSVLEPRIRGPHKQLLGPLTWRTAMRSVAVVVLSSVAQILNAGQTGVPDHYSALRTYIEGAVLEVSADGTTLLIEQQNPIELVAPGDPLERDPRNAMASDSMDELQRGLARVSLRHAKGWVFIDDPDGGPQRRVRLADFRLQFRPGHVIEIGAAPGLKSGASEGHGQIQTAGGRGSSQTSTGLVVTISGWVYIRLNAWRLSDKEQQR